MAEIQDTLGLKPKLDTYQARPVTYKDPVESKALNIPEVDAKVWNSVTRNLVKVLEIDNATKVASHDLVKNNIGTEIADHYSEQKAYILNNINKFGDEELDTGEFFKKYDNKELKIKEYQFKDGLSNEAKEEMEHIRKTAERDSRNTIRQALHQELVSRTGDMLDNKANKSINLLRNDLIELEKEFPEGFANKFLVNNKNDKANEYMKRYTDVLDSKLYGNMMDEKEKERRIYQYGQKLGNVLFEHYAKVDQPTAIDLARKRKFIVGGIPLDSAIVGKYILNQEDKRKSDVEAGKRLSHKVELQSMWTKNPEYLIKMYSTQEVKKTNEGKLETINVIRPVSDRMFEMVGKKHGYTTKDEFAAVIKDAVLRAEGKHKEAVKEEKRLKKEKDRKNYETIKIAVGEFIKADSKDTRDTFLHRHFIISDKERPEIAGPAGKREQKAGHYEKIGKRWIVKHEYAQDLAKSYNLDVKEVWKDLQTMVQGIPVRIPGSGMKSRKFGIFQSAVIDYYTKKLFVSEDGVMATDPMDDPELYETGLMNVKEREIYTNIRNGFEDIINFNTNNFTSKSSDTLLKEAGELVKRNTNPSTGQTSLAFATAWKRYKGGILATRVKGLILNPNKVCYQDLKIDHGPSFDPSSLSEEEKTSIQDWWDTNGQDRSRYKLTGGGYMLFPESLVEDIDMRIMSLREMRKFSDAQRVKSAKERAQ